MPGPRLLLVFINYLGWQQTWQSKSKQYDDDAVMIELHQKKTCFEKRSLKKSKQRFW